MNNKQFQSETIGLFDRFKKAVREVSTLGATAYTGIATAVVPMVALGLADGWVRESVMLYGRTGQMPEMTASVKALMTDYAMAGGAVAGATFATMLVAKAAVSIYDKLQELKELKAGMPPKAQAKTGLRGASRIVLDDDEQQLVANHLEISGDSLSTEQLQALVNKGAAMLAFSAKHGDPEAQCRLGEMHLYGVNGVEQNIDKGCSLIESAYKQGHPEASYMYAQMHIDGDGVERDFHKGLEMMQVAAARGSQAAVYSMGDLYQYGVEGKLGKDLQAAERCFEHLERLQLGRGAIALEAVRETMERESIYSENLSVLERQANSGDAHASYKLGSMHFFGVEAEKDTVKAETYLSKAASSGNVKAKSLLGQMYIRGDGVAKRTGTGLVMVEQAAGAKDKGAAAALADFFESGRPFGVDRELARQYTQMAADAPLDDDYLNIALKEYDQPRGGHANAMEAFFDSNGYSSPSADAKMKLDGDSSPSPTMG